MGRAGWQFTRFLFRVSEGFSSAVSCAPLKHSLLLLRLILTSLLFLLFSHGKALGQSVPSGWTDSDIGSVGLAGSTTYANDVFTVKGAGAAIYGNADTFHFLYRSLSGDGSIVARIVSSQGGSGYAAAGVMIRETLDPGSTNAKTAYWSAYAGTYFDLRATTGGTTSEPGSVSNTLPYWVKVVRSGSTFSSFTSTNGVTWTQLGTSQTISMAQNVYIGLAVNSGSTSALCTTTFDSVSVSSSSSPAPAITSVSPTIAAVGSQVVLSGSGFGAAQGASLVRLSGASMTVNSWSDTSITITVSTGATSGNLIVSVAPSMNDSNPVFLTVPGQPLTGWADLDVGAVGLAGSASYANGVFTVNGAGCGTLNCGNGNPITDGFHYVYQSLYGDGWIVARILTSPTSYTQAGIMIRESLNANSTNEFVYCQNSGASGNSIYQTGRTTTGAATSSQGSVSYITLPYWVKLVRAGSTFTGYQSLDGVNWIQIGPSVAISMTQSVYIGLGVDSYSTSTLATATFDNVSIGSTAAPAPAITSVSATTGNIGSQVVITGTGFGNTQGSSVVYLNGTAATITSWSATSITITIPTGATSGPLVVAVAPSMNSSNPVVFTVTANPLPTEWLDRDVGYVPPPGSASYSNGVFTVKGAGCGFSNCGNGLTTTDAFHFVYQSLSGDGTILARVVSLQAQPNTSGWEAGVIFRETLAAGSAYEFLGYASPSSALVWTRSSAGANGTNVATQQYVSLPVWIKITRTGNLLTAYTSTDGMNWVQLGGYQWTNMAQNLFVGVGVTSGANSNVATATLDNLSVSSASSPAPNISSLSATTGPIGSQVVISGSGFGATQGNSVVLLNGAPTTINSWSATSISVTIPSGATSGYLAVTVAPSLNTSNPFFFTITSQPLLSGWLDQDVGAVGVMGSATASGSVFTVKGAGNATNGVGGTDDGLHFVYQPVSTNATLVARVVSVGGTWGAQAGVMVRETLAANSAEVFPYLGAYGLNYYAYLYYRNVPGGTTGSFSSGATGTVPYWIKLVRNANAFTAYLGPDGVQWAQLGTTQTFTATQTVYMGLGVSSGTQSTLATATFDNVSLTLGGTLPNPLVSGLTPTSGTPGSQVTISGSSFGATQGTSSVSFNGATATISSWSDSQIVAIVPDGATTGPVSVTVGNITSQGPMFSVQFTAQLTDSLNNQSSYTSALVGGQWSFTSTQGSGCSTCTTRGTIQKEYDGQGNARTITDALGLKTKYVYDSGGNVTSTSSQLADGTTVQTSYTYNSLGQVLTATDPLGNVTTNTYDSNGNLLTVTTPSPDGTTPGSVTTFTYDTKGELLTITDPLNHVTTLTYTAAGLIATITDAQNHVTTYGYDVHGNRTSVKDANNNTTTFTYDAGDRLTKITYPDLTTTQFGYDYRGRRTSVTDQNGKTTTYAYDEANRLTSVTDAALHTTTYAYDSESNLTSITDANLHTTSFTYDAFGRVSKTTFPSGYIETYGYDADNNLTSKTDRKNQTVTYTYDQLNRLAQKTYPDSTNVNYSYDKASRLTQVADPTGTYQFTFDNMGRLTATTTMYSFVSRNFTTSYAYDKASNRTGFTDPESGSTTYAYDTLNRLQTLTPPAAFTTGSFGFGYDALSRRTQMTRPNNVTTNYAYDNLSRLLSVLHQLSGSTIDGASYTLDNAGNRTAKTDQRTAVATSYGYDSIYQLLSATQGANTAESYTYDPVGNRTASLGVSSYTTNSSNELTATSNASYGYDNNGNTLTKVVGSNTTSFTWDFENRLSSVTLPGSGGTVSFKYDPFGRRIYKSSSAGTSIYAYDGNRLAEETNSTGGVVARYSQGPHLDEPLAMLRSAATSFYHADGLGSITSLSNTAGSLAQTYTFDSFGKQTASSGSLTNPFQYTARESDTETGLYYYRARYYDPTTGRFVNEDPIGLKDGLNMYAYVSNGATNFSDPTGLTKTCTPLGDPLQITPWFKWANGPPIPTGPWQFDTAFAYNGPEENKFGGGDTIVCKWSRPVKQDISRYAFFLQQYRCVDDDPKKCGSTPGPWGPIPNNVTIETRIEKKTKPAGFEKSTETYTSPPFMGISVADDMLNELICRTKAAPPH